MVIGNAALILLRTAYFQRELSGGLFAQFVSMVNLFWVEIDVGVEVYID